jgi:hypothetical protein
MRRLIRVLVNVALLALAAPAAQAKPPTGEIVFVGSGAVAGTVTLGSKVGLDFENATVSGGSKYALLALMGKDRHFPAGAVAVFPGSRVREWGFFNDGSGRFAVRMLAAGPTTFTVPATGIRGRLVVRLRQPVRGAFAKLSDVPLAGGAAVSDDLSFAAPASALAVHGFFTDDAPLAEAWSVCAGPRTSPCVGDVERSDPRVPSSSDGVVAKVLWPGLSPSGDLTSHIAAAAAFPVAATDRHATHFALVLPVH